MWLWGEWAGHPIFVRPQVVWCPSPCTGSQQGQSGPSVPTFWHYHLNLYTLLAAPNRLPNSNGHPLILHHWDDMTSQSGDLFAYFCTVLPLLYKCKSRVYNSLTGIRTAHIHTKIHLIYRGCVRDLPRMR